MLEQKDYFGSVLIGLGGNKPVTLREMPWGYVVQSAAPGGIWRLVVDRAARLATVSVWLAVIGLWLWPLAGPLETVFFLKSLVSVALLAGIYVAVALGKRLGGYAFHVDTTRREVRTTQLTRKGQSWITASYRFDEIGEALLQHGKSAETARGLCLRLKAGGKIVPVAIGDEMTLLAVHDRLMRDLRPIEEKMAAYGMLKGSGRKQGVRPSFPLLGPEEIAARKPRQASL